MRHLVIPSDGGPATDPLVMAAGRTVGPDGALVLISVLPGSLVDRSLGPAQRGRRRRAEENGAKERLAAQIARTDPAGDCHVIALFGDVVSDTLLLTRNLGADGIVMGARDPHLEEMLAVSPVPVVVIPDQADAPE